MQIPDTGFLRLWQIVGRPETKGRPAVVGFLNYGRSTWLAGVKSGRFPKPVKLGPNTVGWKVEDIRQLIEKLGQTK